MSNIRKKGRGSILTAVKKWLETIPDGELPTKQEVEG